MTTRRIALVLLVAAAAAAPRPAEAQAWGPGRGEASLYVGYTNTFNRYHYDDAGTQVDRGQTRSQVVAADLVYGLTDRFALRVGIPWVATRYRGAFPHRTPGHELIDDGNTHSTLTDLHLEVRYMAVEGPFVVTPFLLGARPVTAYEQHGHSAFGRQLDTATFGVNLGYRPEKILPNAYVQARYGFTLAEKVGGVSHNSSTVDGQVGYFVTPAMSARVGVHWVVGHGGLAVTPALNARHPLWQFHDQIMDEHTTDLSAGLSFSIGPSLDLHAGAVRTLAGRNGHKIEHAFSIGASWSFSPGSPFGGKSPSVASNTP